MATHYRGTRYPIDRVTVLHIEDAETTGTDNENESISGLDSTVALGRLEAEDNPDELLPSNCARLTAITREINKLCQ